MVVAGSMQVTVQTGNKFIAIILRSAFGAWCWCYYGGPSKAKAAPTFGLLRRLRDESSAIVSIKRTRDRRQKQLTYSEYILFFIYFKQGI